VFEIRVSWGFPGFPSGFHSGFTRGSLGVPLRPSLSTARAPRRVSSRERAKPARSSFGSLSKSALTPFRTTASPECQDLIPPRAASRVCEDRFSHQACATLESRTDPWIDRAEHRARRVKLPLEMRVHPKRTTGARPGWWQRIDWMTIPSVNTPTDCAWWRAVRDRADRWGSRSACSNACTE